MTKPPKRPRDFSQAAKLVVDIATGQVEDREPTPEEQGKDPVAVRRGQLGGAVGGRARAESLPQAKRTAFSKKVENHAAAVALHAMYYNFVRHPPNAQNHSGNGRC